jgi:hypothetical protein
MIILTCVDCRMGGVGKSCISSAVIQQAAVRERFPDGLAWVGLVRGSSSSLSPLSDMDVTESEA